MTVFAPAGSSIVVVFTQFTLSQTVVLPVVPATNGAIRIVWTSGGSGTRFYIKLGTSEVTVSSSDGMTIKPTLYEENIVGIGAAETHLAILLAGAASGTVSVTSGSIIA